MYVRASVAAVLASALAASAAHAQPLKCPTDKLDELRAFQPLPVFLNLITPLRVLHGLTRDRMADLPRKPVSFRVIDEVGRAVPNALVAVIHKESNRFLAEGAAGGPAIGLPQGGYTVNAAVADKSGSVRFGSAEFSLDAKGPSAVTVKLTGNAGAAVPKPLVASAPVASQVEAGFESALRESAVLAVVRQGSNVRSKDDKGEGAILGQYEMEDAPSRVFTLPGKAGKYDVVAMLCAPRIPLTRWSISTAPVQIGISAPDRVPMGGSLRVTLSGAVSAASKVRFGKSGDEFGAGEEIKAGDKPEVFFDAGYETGPFQIAVLAHDDTVLASRTVTVERREMSINGPDTVRLGAQADFTWPGNSAADLEVWTIANGKTPARRLSTVEEKRLIAPAGSFELRLIRRGSFEGEGVMARKRIRIEGNAFADVPPEAVAGKAVAVRMALNVEFFDQLHFYQRGSKNNYEMNFKTNRNPNVIEIEAPRKPGAYDLVFRLGTVRDKVEVARVPIEVRAR